MIGQLLFLWKTVLVEVVGCGAFGDGSLTTPLGAISNKLPEWAGGRYGLQSNSLGRVFSRRVDTAKVPGF